MSDINNLDNTHTPWGPYIKAKVAQVKICMTLKRNREIFLHFLNKKKKLCHIVLNSMNKTKQKKSV